MRHKNAVSKILHDFIFGKKKEEEEGKTSEIKEKTRIEIDSYARARIFSVCGEATIVVKYSTPLFSVKQC